MARVWRPINASLASAYAFVPGFYDPHSEGPTTGADILHPHTKSPERAQDNSRSVFVALTRGLALWKYYFRTVLEKCLLYLVFNIPRLQK